MNAVSKSVLSGAFIALATSGAWGADLGPYKPYSPPPPEPVQSYEPPIWEGAYIGINGGYGWAGASAGDAEGAFGGGQVGYNWQRGRFVFGIEGDMQASDINGRSTTAFSDAKTDVDWFSTVRGRIGIAEGPLLLYGTGGLAIADIYNRVDLAIPAVTLKESGVHTGYAVGGGLEWAFARNWTAKAEYLFLGFGDDTIAGGGFETKVNNDIHTVRAGLNYKF